MSKKPLVRRLFFNATTHLIILGIFFILQVVMVALLSYFVQNISFPIYLLLYLIALIFCINLSIRHDNPSTLSFWIVLIAIFPAFGILLYLMWGLHRHGKRRHNLEHKSHEAAQHALDIYKQNEIQTCTGALCSDTPPSALLVAQYLEHQGFPLYSQTQFKYLGSGEDFYDDCIDEMKHAKKTIFLCFFIFREGKLWDRIHKVLIDRIKNGVEVRLLFDGAGTLFSLSKPLIEYYRKEGINIQIFNPTHKYINNFYLNYRNHQKYVIIDGNIGYTGGVNLSDEYANYTSPLGYWKDTGIKLVGRGVYGMSVTFINMWDQTVGQLSDDYSSCYPSIIPPAKGCCHVFDDGPYNNPKNPAEGMINRMIETAHQSLMIATPYLAISQNFVDLICRTAKSGVRVKLVVPCRFDHWYVFEVTRSYFIPLIKAGVEVYRYSPGMMHAKMIIVDNTHALVGSINLDNRSFYIQYEGGVWCYDNPVIKDIASDFDQMVAQSSCVSVDDIESAGRIRNFGGFFLRLFSPLM